MTLQKLIHDIKRTMRQKDLPGPVFSMRVRVPKPVNGRQKKWRPSGR